MKKLFLVLALIGLVFPQIRNSGRVTMTDKYVKNPRGGTIWKIKAGAVTADNASGTFASVTGQSSCFPVRKENASAYGFGAATLRKVGTDADSSAVAIAIHSKNEDGLLIKSFNRHSHTDYAIDTLFTSTKDTGNIEFPFHWTIAIDSVCFEIRAADLTGGEAADSLLISQLRIRIE